ncbi:hypothetical protein [Nocardia farcinica]|uniref:hypothetical protein n=1 Tax=Nocardia farcinica TaxID=37329 RepID=UPI001895CC6A|nr:hypothetical protein [Nocardia farcinica]MBF6234496.1 hypothetical protein [Nocardia farcinica]
MVSAADLPGSADGVHNGVGYAIGPGADGRGLSAEFTGGSFRLAGDVLEVVDTAETVIITLVPLNVVAGEYVLGLVPRLADGGTQLVAGVSAQDIGYWRKNSPQQRPISRPTGLIVGLLGSKVIGRGIGASVPNFNLPDQWDCQEESEYIGDYRYCW